MTHDSKRGIRQYDWQYDSAHIIYSQDQGGDEDFHLYQADLTTGETRDLTPFEKTRAAVIAFEPKFPGTQLIILNKRDSHWFDVYRLNLLDGSLELVETNDRSVVTLFKLLSRRIIY